MNFLDLVENYSDDIPLKPFDKVKVIIARAKDLQDGKPILAQNLEGRKTTAVAQYELMTELIDPDIHQAEKDEDKNFEHFDELIQNK